MSETLTLQGTGVTDVEMLNTLADTNRDGAALAVGNSGTQTQRTLLKFDLSSISAGSTIDTATLTLTYAVDASSNARTLSVYRVKRAWVETEATWNSWKTGSAWSTAGCANTTSDREAADIGTATQPASPTLNTTLDITLTAAKIQEMITGGAFTNNGLLLQVDSESSDRITYYDTEEATAGYRPKLVVTYTEAVPASFFAMF
jgi:hypothetical protein